ncbi:MAG: hypothetical protein U5K79_16465 [Cyclobacteriaceae bacterium]|nr:hypothetical protein [Cyclobacteriaceae bacterium]
MDLESNTFSFQDYRKNMGLQISGEQIIDLDAMPAFERNHYPNLEEAKTP